MQNNVASELITFSNPETKIELRNYKSLAKVDLETVFEFTIGDIEKRLGSITFYRLTSDGISIGLSHRHIFDSFQTEFSYLFRFANEPEKQTNNFVYSINKDILTTTCVNKNTFVKVYSSEMNMEIVRYHNKECS